jgi:hypothetical protein
MEATHLRIKVIFEPHFSGEMLEDALKYLEGKKIKAFGKGSQSYWYEGEEQEFEIETVDVTYVDVADNFFSMNLYLKDYDGSKTPVYTDKKFERKLKRLMPGFKVNFSEQGMQGPEFANFDVSFSS